MRGRRILVIQLCRLGDILQTTPLLRGLRASEPGAHVTLALLDGFGHAPVPSHLYDDRALFPFERIAERVAGAREDWQAALTELRSWTRALTERPFDVVVNVTNSTLSGLLASVADAPDVRGAVVAPDRTSVARGSWTTYLWASLRARALGCFNLVDVMAWMGGVPRDGRGLEIDVPAAAVERIGSWLASQHAGRRPLIAVQLGASDERKRWPPERVAEALDRLPDDWGDLVFVGTSHERPLYERARAVLRRGALDAIGATAPSELAALLARCRLLLSNDTGTMHVAAAVGTRVVDLSTGPVYVHETGPYGEGHVAVEPTSSCFPCVAGATCHHLSCRDDFTPPEIAAVVAWALGEDQLPHPRRARILRARMQPQGFIQYETLWTPSGSRLDEVRHALAAMWLRTLPLPGDPAARQQAPSAAVRSDDAGRTLEAIAADAMLASRWARQLAGADPKRQAGFSTRIDEARRRLGLAAQLHLECAPIVHYLDVALESAADPDVARVADIYARELETVAHRARVFAELLPAGAAAVVGRAS